MLGCPYTPPETLREFVQLIEWCARIHGGEDWGRTALLGLIGLAVLLLPLVALYLIRTR